MLISRLPSPFGSEFEGWDNPFTEGGAISKDADLILRHNSTLINKIHLIQFLIIPLKKKIRYISSNFSQCLTVDLPTLGFFVLNSTFSDFGRNRDWASMGEKRLQSRRR